MKIGVSVAASMALFLAVKCHAQPFSGTIFIDPDIITSSDHTTFTGLDYAGTGDRIMFDRRVNSFITVNAFLFNAEFSDGLLAEIQVNPEFGTVSAATNQASKYGTDIGRLPNILRSEVETVWIHRGVEPFGGGNNNILIHTGQAEQYSASGILEETLVHEASHTSLDAAHANSPGWTAAQLADPNFISTYARDNPTREDIAESFLPYLAVRYRSDRISPSLANTISTTIPNRMAYFDDQDFDMFPIPEPSTLALAALGLLGIAWRRKGIAAQLPLRNQILPPLHTRQKQNRLLNVGGQVQQVHDLCDAGAADVAEASEFGLVAYDAVTD